MMALVIVGLLLFPELVGYLYLAWCFFVGLRAIWHFQQALQALDRQRRW